MCFFSSFFLVFLGFIYSVFSNSSFFLWFFRGFLVVFCLFWRVCCWCCCYLFFERCLIVKAVVGLVFEGGFSWKDGVLNGFWRSSEAFLRILQATKTAKRSWVFATCFSYPPLEAWEVSARNFDSYCFFPKNCWKLYLWRETHGFSEVELFSFLLKSLLKRFAWLNDRSLWWGTEERETCWGGLGSKQAEDA